MQGTRTGKDGLLKSTLKHWRRTREGTGGKKRAV